MRGMSAVALGGERKGSSLLSMAMAQREERRRREADWQEYLKQQEMQQTLVAQQREFKVQLGMLNSLAERMRGTESPTERKLLMDNSMEFINLLMKNKTLAPYVQQILKNGAFNPQKLRDMDWLKDNPTPRITEQDSEIGPTAIAAKMTQIEAHRIRFAKERRGSDIAPRMYQPLDDKNVVVWNGGEYVPMSIENWQKGAEDIAAANNMSVQEVIGSNFYGRARSVVVDIDGKRQLVTIRDDLLGTRGPKTSKQILGDVPGSKTGGGGARTKVPDKLQNVLTLWNAGAKSTNNVENAMIDELNMFADKYDKEPMKFLAAVENYMWRDPEMTGFTPVVIPNIEGEAVRRGYDFPFGLELKFFDGAYLGIVPGRPTQIRRPNGDLTAVIYDQMNDQFYNYGDGRPVSKDFIQDLMLMDDLKVPSPVEDIRLLEPQEQFKVGAPDIYKSLWGKEHPSIKVKK